MRLLSRLLVLILALACSLAAERSSAETLRGADGEDGRNGTGHSHHLPTDGEDGGDGESFDLMLGPPVSSGRVSVYAGDGGDGGRGGYGVPQSHSPYGPLDGGDGGDGGNGGEVSVRFSGQVDPGYVELRLYGGDGGEGARAGTGAAGWDDGEAGRAGDGGSAVAEIESSARGFVQLKAGHGGDDVAGALPAGQGGSVGLFIDAVSAGQGVSFGNDTGWAGAGGDSRSGGTPGAGGDATAVITGVASGDEDLRLTSNNSWTGGMRGGLGGYIASEGGATTGGAGGNADSRTIGTALGDGDVTVLDRSDAGSGGSVSPGYRGSGGEGGDASSSAIGHGEGSGRVRVEANAFGWAGGTGRGSGQRGGAAGSTSASARATSAGGGDAEAKVSVGGGRGGDGFDGANGANGRSVVLRDAVSGATSGELTLEQYAQGGSGGGGKRNGNGGAAFSSLSGDNAGGGDLVIHSEARGGTVHVAPSYQAPSSGIGGRSGAATASAHGRGLGDASVDVTAHAIGVAAAGTVDAGQAQLGPVRGESEGAGSVRVSGIVTGGEGSRDGGRASGARIVNAVDGQTAGDLFLFQSAEAGDAGANADADNRTGQFDGVDALSSLTRSVSAASFELQSLAHAGDAGWVGALDPTRAPSGGTATAQGDAHNDAGSVKVLLRASGGHGWDAYRTEDYAGAFGGDALLDARGSTRGDGHDVVVGLGGSAVGGAFGGNATSRSVGIAEGNSRVDVRDRAVGAYGHRARDGSLRSGGNGGDASSTARGQNAGDEQVFVRALASAGNGGNGVGVGERGGAGGNASAEAWGASSGGGDVTVEAHVESGAGGPGDEGADSGRGADAHLIDAVGGTTAGVLTLEQNARAGEAGSGRNGQAAGEGGDASSVLHAVNPGGGDLVASVEARAGSSVTGYRGLGTGDAGSAFASIVAQNDNASSIDVSAKVIGGGSPDGRAGEAALGEVSGTSTGGGDVSVSGKLELLTGRAPGGPEGSFDAQDVTLENAVTGSTRGSLSLSQSARASGGGLDAATGIAGRSGHATSILSHTTSSRELTLASQAYGGNGRSGLVPLAADGGTATSEAHAENLDGSARALARAGGGVGAVQAAGGPDALNDGANAWARASATSHGDGHDVVVGGLPEESGAFGGSGLRPYGIYGDFVAGSGGDGSSESVGTALGNSRVEVYDRAMGGGGGGGTREVSQAGMGGDAVSFATGSNAGDEAVEVTAHATGGNGGEAWYGVVGDGGSAEARASGFSTGGGDVHVTAIQEGGGTHSGRIGGAGGASTMSNAVTGSTRGTLTLEQVATGGSAGWSWKAGSAGHGGEARSTLFSTNPGGGDLVLRSVALGGQGGRVTEPDTATGRGADAGATAVGIGSRGTAVEAEATGGAGGTAKYGASLLGDGGAADARALAMTGSRELATANATARGGDVDVAMSQPVPGGLGGAANARATAIGRGEVASRATAIGGMGARAPSGLPANPGGSATARADAIGRSGSAAAEARSTGRPGESLTLSATAPLARWKASAVTSTRVGEAPSSQARGNAWAHGSLRPDLDAVMPLLEGQEDILGASRSDGSQAILASGSFGTKRELGLGRDVLLHEIEIGIEVSTLFDASQDDLVLALFDPDLDKGIEWLDFRIFQAGALLLEEHFESGKGALRFFSDNVIDLDELIFGDDLPDGPALLDLDLEVAIDVALRKPRSGFGASFAAGLSTMVGSSSAVAGPTVLTPEPGTGVLMALGLLALAARRRRTR